MNESAEFTVLFRTLLAAVDERLARFGQRFGMRGSTIDASFLRGEMPSGAVGRVTVRVGGGADVGSRPRVNLILGPNVTIAAVDDSGSEEIDVTVEAWEPVTNGDAGSPEIVFDAGDVVMDRSA